MKVEQQFEKARIYAYWSFIGFVVPVVGIITSAISMSILDRFIVDDTDEQDEHERLKTIAVVMNRVSIAIAVIALIGMVIVSVVVINDIVANHKLSQTSQQTQQALKNLLEQ